MLQGKDKVLKIADLENECQVILDRERGILEFTGRFLPQKTGEFYEPILEWIDEYSKEPHRKTVVIFKLDYFNTSSSKKFLDIMLLFFDMHQKGSEVHIEWYHHKDDIDIKEAGYGYADLVDLPFKFLEY